jgi:hypothetical protein
MGLAAHTTPVLVKTGYGRSEAARRPDNIPEVPVVANLIEAVSLILQTGTFDAAAASGSTQGA